MTNLTEFAFDTLPNNPSSGLGAIVYSAGTVTKHGQPTVAVSAHPGYNDYYAVFGRRADYEAAGLVYTVQFSADLIAWEPSTDTPTTVATDGTIDAVSVLYPLHIINPSTGPRPQFFRVVVTMP